MRNMPGMLTVDVRNGLLTRNDFISWYADTHADQTLALCLSDEAPTSTDFVLAQVNKLGRQQAFPDTDFLDVLLYSAALPLQDLLAGEVLSQLHGLTDRVEDPLLHALFLLLQRRHFWEDHFDTHAGRMLDQRPFLVANDFYILAARAEASPVIQEATVALRTRIPRCDGLLLRTKFTDAVECGRCTDGENLFPRACSASEPYDIEWLQVQYAFLQVMQATLSHDVRTVTALLQEYQLATSRDDTCFLLQSLYGDPPQRRQLLADETTMFLYLSTSSGLMSYGPLRLACAEGNIDQVRQFLLYRNRRGLSTWLDDFFWFRYYLLRSEFDQAQQALRRVYVAAQRYGALARLEFEWHIAPEVRIEQWVSALVGGVTPGLAKQRHTAMQQLRGNDPETQAVRDAIRRYAPRSEIVLVTGETGVGKELVSRALHEESGLDAGPFVSVNCAALNESLLEAELFGVTQGAFTGAESDQEGLLGAAEGGVLFLDEIGDTSLRFQALVLRLLENGEYRRVGDDALLYARCRFIAATNADLERRVADGTFRADLWHRLQHLIISLPPLRQRGRDIEDLAHYYLSHYCPGASFTEDALVAVRHYRWPGNVRQMQHVLEKMVIDHPGQLAFAPEHLPERIRLNS